MNTFGKLVPHKPEVLSRPYREFDISKSATHKLVDDGVRINGDDVVIKIDVVYTEKSNKPLFRFLLNNGMVIIVKNIDRFVFGSVIDLKRGGNQVFVHEGKLFVVRNGDIYLNLNLPGLCIFSY